MRIVIVDDHQVVRDGLIEFLADPLVEIVGVSGDAQTAIEVVVSHTPDAVLMDVRMDEFDGLWALEQLKVRNPALPVVFLSSYDNPTYMARAIALGANDYLLKNSSKCDILASLRRGVLGQPSPPDGLLERVRRSMAVNRVVPKELAEFSLTHREVQVLRHVGLGLSNKEIAKSLGISVETVKEHVQNILRKTKATDRTDAAVKAVKWDWWINGTESGLVAPYQHVPSHSFPRPEHHANTPAIVPKDSTSTLPIRSTAQRCGQGGEVEIGRLID
jgi:DNA-binding NarL/FixJ family response regulator